MTTATRQRLPSGFHCRRSRGKIVRPVRQAAPPPNGLMRWIVRWRRWFCFLLNFVRLARPDCEHCNEYVKCWGTDMRKRLDELR